MAVWRCVCGVCRDLRLQRCLGRVGWVLAEESMACEAFQLLQAGG